MCNQAGEHNKQWVELAEQVKNYTRPLTKEEQNELTRFDYNITKYSERCTCKCVNHPEADLIKESFSGQGYCPLCKNFNLSDEYDDCGYCRGRYDQYFEDANTITKLEAQIDEMRNGRLNRR